MNKIAAFGEILFDIYANSKSLGGAPLNFIYHINKLTGSGRIISRVGKDSLGREAIDFLNSQGVLTNNIQIDDEHQTGAAIISLNEKGEPTFNIEENRAYDFINIDDDTKSLISQNTECLYFGTLAQRNEVSRNTLQSFFNKNIKYFFDVNIRQKFFTKEILSSSLNVANVVKLNFDELKLLNELFVQEIFDIETASKNLIDKFNIELLAITKGADGSVMFRDGKVDEQKPEPWKVVDTVGAGDAFAAITCIGYLKEWSLDKINKLANEFAGQICLINGALPKDDSVYDRFKNEIEQ
jgi:fructokinase